MSDYKNRQLNDLVRPLTKAAKFRARLSNRNLARTYNNARINVDRELA